MGNTVNGGAAGVNYAYNQNVYAPYDLLASANTLTLNHATWGGSCGGLNGCPSIGTLFMTSSNVSVVANSLVRGDRGIAYQNTFSTKAKCGIYALCNDFGAAQYSSLFVQDPLNMFIGMTNLSSRLSYNSDGCHLYLGVPSTPTVYSTNYFQGNQFLNSAGTVVSPIFNPAVVPPWVDNTGRGYGWNAFPGGTYYINNPTSFNDGTFSFF